MSRAHALILLLLSALVLCSALGVVYAKYASRKLFVELESLRGYVLDEEVEWGRLLLEQSTLAAHARVERIARDDLSLRQPRPEEVRLLRP
jgi:cell division protein FtsL